MSRLLLPDSAKQEAPQVKLTLGWANDGVNVVMTVQSGAIVSQVRMSPELAIQLGEGLTGSANQVLELQRKATAPTLVN
jgi:hypothetical protein